MVDLYGKLYIPGPSSRGAVHGSVTGCLASPSPKAAGMSWDWRICCLMPLAEKVEASWTQFLALSKW